jgi:hypothetical protein
VRRETMLAIELALLFVYIAAGEREREREDLFVKKGEKAAARIDSRQTKYSNTKSIPNTERVTFSPALSNA